MSARYQRTLIAFGLLTLSTGANAQSLATDPLATARGLAQFPFPSARLESAAYAPGTVGGPGFSADRWVYAYQLFSSSSISRLDVHFVLGGGGSDVAFNPLYGVPGGATPSVTNPIGLPGVDGGLRALFAPPLAADQRSVVFWFTSVSSPFPGIAGLNGDQFSAWEGTILSPIPAPGALTLLTMGGVFAIPRRRR